MMNMDRVYIGNVFVKHHIKLKVMRESTLITLLKWNLLSFIVKIGFKLLFVIEIVEKSQVILSFAWNIWLDTETQTNANNI